MNTSRSKQLAMRLALVVAGASLAFGATALPASAHHADEKVEVSKTTDLTDGETVKVTFSGFTPGGKPAKVVIAGQGEMTTIPDKLNFDEYAVAPETTVAADGTGSFDLVVVADHGTVQDGTTLDCKVQQCWVIVVQEPFLPQPNYDSVPITFAGGSGAAPTTVAGATETTAVTPETAPTTAAAAATTTVTAAEATTTTVAEAETTAASEDSSDDDEGGSGALYAIIAAVVVVLGAGGFVIARRKPPVG